MPIEEHEFDHEAIGLQPPAITTKVALSMLRVAALLTDELDEHLNESTGLGLSEVLVILQLMFAGGRLKMADLADTIVVTRGGVTRIVDRLVKAGYLARVHSVDDRRVVYAEVTDAGRSLITEAQPGFEAVTEQRIGAMLGYPEVANLHSILHTLSCENPGWEPPATTVDTLD